MSAAKMLTATEMTVEIQRFFESFCADFSAFDGALIAQRYAVPYIALSADGLHQSFDTKEQVGQYFQAFLNKYQEQGCRSCRFTELDIVPIGKKSALASVTWELLRGDLTVVSSWRESYNITHSSGELRIYASTDHA